MKLGINVGYWGMGIGPEEQLMLDVFGDDYRAYMERTKKIIPRVY